MPFLPRRTVLRAGAALAVATGAGITLATPATAAPKEPPLSANGWPTEQAPDADGTIWTRPVPGTDLKVAVRMGDVEAVLVYVIRRFHYEVDELRAGEVTAFQPLRGRSGYQSNYASGTAVAIRPGWYPPGTTGDLLPHQRSVIADIIGSCQGVVRWGGTFRKPHEAHFQIDVPPADPRLAKVADLLRRWEHTPGRGAGVLALGA